MFMLISVYCLAALSFNQSKKIDRLKNELNVGMSDYAELLVSKDHWKKRAAFWKAADKSSAKMAYDCAKDHPKWGRANP